MLFNLAIFPLLASLVFPTSAAPHGLRVLEARTFNISITGTPSFNPDGSLLFNIIDTPSPAEGTFPSTGGAVIGDDAAPQPVPVADETFTVTVTATPQATGSRKVKGTKGKAAKATSNTKESGQATGFQKSLPVFDETVDQFRHLCPAPTKPLELVCTPPVDQPVTRSICSATPNSPQFSRVNTEKRLRPPTTPRGIRFAPAIGGQVSSTNNHHHLLASPPT
ncbi:hypothetical protein B0H17DRAFT_1179297 [Mycena rosella]|uniref:Uncharacterized protein n=1 Tax=Mycena rosella TaxID=1033263 RepID=A0AAD7GJT8_MYCRO|nr:hypothetical protein B0H17DRAFT_1179297 [Mycena rosella]